MSLSKVGVPTCDCRWAFESSPYGIVGGERIMVPTVGDKQCKYCQYYVFIVRVTKAEYEKLKVGKKIKGHKRKKACRKDADREEINYIDIAQTISVEQRTRNGEEEGQEYLPSVWPDYAGGEDPGAPFEGY